MKLGTFFWREFSASLFVVVLVGVVKTDEYSQGFTLIELIMVVAIIGTLAAVAIPAYQSYVTGGHEGAAMKTTTPNVVKLQVCTQTGNDCDELNNHIAADAVLAIAPAAGQGVTSDLTYTNQGCSLVATVDGVGTVAYVISGVAPISDAQCAQGAGQN